MRAAIVLLIAGAFLSVAAADPVPGQGTWQTTLQPRDLDGNLLDGPEAFYDADLNITWLRDTSVAYGKSIGSSTGAINYQQAQTWVDSVDIGGVGDWRLPATLPVNGIAFNYTYSTNGQADLGYWGTASEMAHLFYVELGNAGYCPHTDISLCAGSLPVVNPQAGLTNSGLFVNFVGEAYLSGTPYAPSPQYDSWIFDIYDGDQDYCLGCGPHGPDSGVQAMYALAVHNGDVGVPIPAVPEPASGTLLALGLASLLLIGVSGRSRRQAFARMGIV